MTSPTLKPNVCLRRARLERGFSQADLAERVGVSPRQVCRWERGSAQPRPHMRMILSRVLSTSLQDLSFDLVTTDTSDHVHPAKPALPEETEHLAQCQGHPLYQAEYHAFLTRSEVFHQQPCLVSFTDWFLAAYPEQVGREKPLDHHSWNQSA